jgi:hypothetical protein
MGMNIYAAVFTTEDGRTMVNPVVPFSSWEDTRRKPGVTFADVMAAETSDEHDALHEPNPDYIPGMVLNVSNGNAYTIFRALGLRLDEEGGPTNFPLEEVYNAITKRLHGTRPLHTRPGFASVGGPGAQIIDCGADEAYVRGKLEALLALVLDGGRRQATHLAVC